MTFILCFPLFALHPLLGCAQQSEPVSQIENPLPACNDYTHDASIYGYCVYKNAASITDLQSMGTYCDQAVEWREDCRQVWVISHIDQEPLETLLHVCGQNYDCALQLLDKAPHNDVHIQMERCMEYAGHYKHDCVMHAAQAWYFDWPPEEEIRRVAKQPAPFAEQIGMYIAARVACDGVGSCAGDAEIQMMCEKYVDIFQDKRECPNQHRNRKGRKRSDWQ